MEKQKKKKKIQDENLLIRGWRAKIAGVIFSPKKYFPPIKFVQVDHF